MSQLLSIKKIYNCFKEYILARNLVFMKHICTLLGKFAGT